MQPLSEPAPVVVAACHVPMCFTLKGCSARNAQVCHIFALLTQTNACNPAQCRCDEGEGCICSSHSRRQKARVKRRGTTIASPEASEPEVKGCVTPSESSVGETEVKSCCKPSEPSASVPQAKSCCAPSSAGAPEVKSCCKPAVATVPDQPEELDMTRSTAPAVTNAALMPLVPTQIQPLDMPSMAPSAMAGGVPMPFLDDWTSNMDWSTFPMDGSLLGTEFDNSLAMDDPSMAFFAPNAEDYANQPPHPNPGWGFQ
jgi:hypothetical protein